MYGMYIRSSKSESDPLATKKENNKKMFLHFEKSLNVISIRWALAFGNERNYKKITR